MKWYVPGVWAVIMPTRVYLFISYAPMFSFMYCKVRIFALSPVYESLNYLCFISFLYLDLYVLGDDSWIS